VKQTISYIARCLGLAAALTPMAGLAATVDVAMVGFAFSPKTVTIQAGDTVRWTNQDPFPHTSTSGPNNGVSCTPDGKWNSPSLTQGQTFSFQFTEAGTFPYYCIPHCPSMNGTIIVQGGGGNQGPVVNITSPTNGAAFPGGASISIAAEASDPDGTVARVDFFDGTNSLGNATAAPYSVTATLAPGSHTLTAVATDNEGKTTTSAGVTISVAATPINDPIPKYIAKGDQTIELETVLDGLASPLGVASPNDGSGRMFLFDQSGVVWVVTAGGKLANPLLDVSSRLVSLGAYDERGLLGMAVHPNFGQQPLIYTFTSEPNGRAADFPSTIAAGTTNNHQSVLAEWRIDVADSNRVAVASRREILRIDKPQSNHNGGTIAFGPDGMLYIGTGDGGGANDVGNGHATFGNAQDTTSILGKFLRIDVSGTNSRNGQYGIPNDNPFVAGGGLPEIYAYGFRNPFQWSFDRQTGQLYVGDVGQNNVEDVDVVVKGGNYGWRAKEGTFWFDPSTGRVVTTPVDPVPTNDIPPIAQYGHGEGVAIIGGYVYRGTQVPSLAGRYVFGDWGTFGAPSGRLFYLDATNGIHEFRIGLEDRPLGQWIKGMGQGPDGELYVLTSRMLGPSGNTGKMLKIVPAAAPMNMVASVSNGTNMNVTWAGGQGPYAVQKKTDISAPTWESAQFTLEPNATLSLQGTAGFFRVMDTAPVSMIPFTARLSGAFERPNPVTTSGSGSATLSLDGNTLVFNITFSGLSSDVVGAHIHGPSSIDGRGPVTLDLMPYHIGPASTQGAISGTAVITDAQKAMLLASQTYINVHTVNHNGGEIRGHITPVLMQMALSGANERPGPVSTPASGLGLAALVGNQLTLNVAYRGLTAAANGAHIHGPATPDAGAGVLKDLSGFTGTGFGTEGSLAGTLTLTDTELASVIGGLTYVNIHTPTYQGGEIRGQVLPQTLGIPLTAALSGTAANATNVTSGTGLGIFSLEGTRLLFTVVFSNLTASVTGIHIHGPAGATQSGPVFVDLAGFRVGELGTSGTVSGAVTLTPTQVSWVVGGQTYVNVHTANHRGGEIRGQLVPVLLSTTLTGAQERNTPVVTTGFGSGTMTLVGNQLGFNLSYRDLVGTAIGSHIHGPASAFQNAGILYDLGNFNGGAWGQRGSLAGSLTLSAANLTHLIGGQTYVNIHSTTNNGGEIRGQIRMGH
jgi:glucose/arabinose dehydrogenase/plastocyanin/Cu/Zn superoxide dismutase